MDKLRPQALAIIKKALVDDDRQIVNTAIEVVASTKQMDLMGQVEKLLFDDYIPVRFAAAQAVGDTRYYRAKGSVEKLLKAPDEHTRIAAAYAMNQLGSPGSMGLLGEALKSQDQTVRANAATLLGKTGDPGVLKLLQWVQHDKDSTDKVKLVALDARARLGDKTIFRKLWSISHSSYWDDRIMAVKAMGALGTRIAKDVLMTKLDDNVAEVRLAAAEQLGILGDETGVPEVLDVFTKQPDQTLGQKELENIKILTAMAIGQIGTEELTCYLPELINDDSMMVRIAAARAILQCTSDG
ncbi:HEAT repeat domain-containing protein [Planctomycetota bacterium]